MNELQAVSHKYLKEALRAQKDSSKNQGEYRDGCRHERGNNIKIIIEKKTDAMLFVQREPLIIMLHIHTT